MTVFVPGIVRSQGSKRAFMPRGGTRPVIVEDGAHTRPWRQDVRQAAIEAGWQPIEGPIDMQCEFVMARPRSHFNSKGELNAVGRRRKYPDGKPDIDKALRLMADSLTGIAFTDDARIVAVGATKRWVDASRPTDLPGVLIHVWPADRPQEGPA